jgi:vacuolar-type H+-ATPase subunit E/Vma4
MGLEAILEAIRASGRAQVKEIETRTEAEAEQILGQAGVEAQKIRNEARQAALSGAAAERARILHEERLKGIRLLGNMQKDLVDMALTHAGERLAEWRSMPAYPTVLRSLVEEALAELPQAEQEHFRLQADPRDRLLIEEILPEIGCDVHATYPLDSCGGAVVTSWDERIVVDNTLETRLRRAESFLRRHLPRLVQ